MSKTRTRLYPVPCAYVYSMQCTLQFQLRNVAHQNNNELWMNENMQIIYQSKKRTHLQSDNFVYIPLQRHSINIVWTLSVRKYVDIWVMFYAKLSNDIHILSKLLLLNKKWNTTIIRAFLSSSSHAINLQTRNTDLTVTNRNAYCVS